VISQFMARYLTERHLTLEQFKATIAEKDETTIRRFLSGDLRLALINEIRAVAAEDGQAFAALYELSDDELLDELCALGPRAHVVLANGSIQKATGEATAQARQRDENATARAKLQAAGVDVQPDHRFTAPGPLAHNKFLVRTDRDGTPRTVWTGSTNWTPTGLRTQVNNGLLVTDPDVAAAYRQQWQRLRDAASSFPPSLVDNNSIPTRIDRRTHGDPAITVWFSRTTRQVDLQALRAEVSAAQHGILFLMFMPGATGLFATVAARAAEPELYVRGVVSELPRGHTEDDGQVHVNLIDNTTQHALDLDIIQPEGIAHPLAHFAAEVTHKQFLAHIGHAIIHSKIIITDPFSPARRSSPEAITSPCQPAAKTTKNFSSSKTLPNWPKPTRLISSAPTTTTAGEHSSPNTAHPLAGSKTTTPGWHPNSPTTNATSTSGASKTCKVPEVGHLRCVAVFCCPFVRVDQATRTVDVGSGRSKGRPPGRLVAVGAVRGHGAAVDRGYGERTPRTPDASAG
jgi:hypothetical protein